MRACPVTSFDLIINSDLLGSPRFYRTPLVKKKAAKREEKKAQKRAGWEKANVEKRRAGTRRHVRAERENRGNPEVGRGKFPIKRPPRNIRRRVARWRGRVPSHGPITKQ